MACTGWSDGTCGGSDSTDPEAVWGCNGTLTTGADGTDIGTGKQNTSDIVTGCPNSGFAARLADDLTLGGQSDWFLPSKEELNALCKWAHDDTVNAVCNNNGSGPLPLTNGGFAAYSYWSSSEGDAENAWLQDFPSGLRISYFKSHNRYVRPIRSF